MKIMISLKAPEPIIYCTSHLQYRTCRSVWLVNVRSLKGETLKKKVKEQKVVNLAGMESIMENGEPLLGFEIERPE